MIRKLCVVMSMTLLINCNNAVSIDCIACENSGGQLLEKIVSESECQSSVQYCNQSKKIEHCNKVREYFTGNDAEERFSGVYINDDDDIVVKMTNKNKKDLKQLQKIDKEIVVETGTYSYDELKSVYENLNLKFDDMADEKSARSILEEKENIFDNVEQFYIDVEDNCVYVCMKNADENKINLFKQYVLDSDAIKFEKNEGEESIDDATTLKLGRAIYVDYGSSEYVKLASIGIKAYYINSDGDKVHGFITAGHATTANGNKVYASSNTSNKEIGTVVKRRYKNGKVDAAFVKVTNSNYKVSSQVYYSNSKGNTKGGAKINVNCYTVLGDGAIGMTVYKAGQTTYLTKGKLVSDKATKITEKGYVIKDTYKCSYKASDGDSGGVVYMYDEEGYQYLGIHQGRLGENTFVVKWENIKDLWNIYFE